MVSLKDILFIILFAGIFALHPDLNKGNDPIDYFQDLFKRSSITVKEHLNISKEIEKNEETELTNETLISQN